MHISRCFVCFVECLRVSRQAAHCAQPYTDQAVPMHTASDKGWPMTRTRYDNPSVTSFNTDTRQRP